ncbi:type IV pilin N-terminal domain-containing protein [Natrarchaeobaculum sulfurireducens]|nr:type IV pilin N-terminal domain-containing protein [Natrarchaeobaculum sulfurireducens]
MIKHRKRETGKRRARDGFTPNPFAPAWYYARRYVLSDRLGAVNEIPMLDGKQISKKLIGSEDERAVSPVIGVILMVAITVILAAVIAAFVLDLGGSVGEEPQAGVDVSDETGENYTVSVTSMGNSDGVAVVNSSGEVVESWDIGEEDSDDVLAHIQSTGGSATVNANSSEEVTNANNVVAYIGGDVSDDDRTLENADETATIASID